MTICIPGSGRRGDLAMVSLATPKRCEGGSPLRTFAELFHRREIRNQTSDICVGVVESLAGQTAEITFDDATRLT